MADLLIGGIVLAAGRGRRYGADKRLAILPDGTTMLQRVVARMRPAVDELLIVIGSGDSESQFRERFPETRVLAAPRSEAGMGASLADAVSCCPHWDAGLVALADKPFLRTSTAQRVRGLLGAGHALVVPLFEGERGHPVGFHGQYFRALAGLSGDHGARELIEREQARCLFLETGDPGVTADVDTPEHLSGWLALLGD